MRADRLLTLMMVLQTRGQTTAAALAKELEVSKRTIYRDIDALSAAGVPVYADGGPGGGYALLDSYRTTLTGLHEDEIRALFMLTIPGPLSDLGLSQQLKGAFLKLTSSLPSHYQEQAQLIRKRIHLDAAGWFQREERLPFLPVVQEAVWQDLQLSMSYRRSGGGLSQRVVSPYGLVAKAGIWYLVAATERGMRVYRVSRVETAVLTQTHFTRPATFDLADFWANWIADYEVGLPKYPVTLSIGPDLIPNLPHILGAGVRSLLAETQPDANGWKTIDYTFERVEEAQTFIMGMGTVVKIIAPDSLRVSIAKLASEIAAHYSE
ncbi:MAG: YafY family transcriptional regulator [Chloroflexi bacterium]|nr:MAG: YafY family transcriptional regulator [Chloroflexota bacterium]